MSSFSTATLPHGSSSSSRQAARDEEAAALRRPFRDRLKIRIRTSRELATYVVCTTALCGALALACDVANQLYFFESWTIAIRSWLITVGMVLLIAAPVSRAIGKANLALYHASRTDPLTGLSIGARSSTMRERARAS